MARLLKNPTIIKNWVVLEDDQTYTLKLEIVDLGNIVTNDPDDTGEGEWSGTISVNFGDHSEPITSSNRTDVIEGKSVTHSQFTTAGDNHISVPDVNLETDSTIDIEIEQEDGSTETFALPYIDIANPDTDPAPTSIETKVVDLSISELNIAFKITDGGQSLQTEDITVWKRFVDTGDWEIQDIFDITFDDLIFLPENYGDVTTLIQVFYRGTAAGFPIAVKYEQEDAENPRFIQIDGNRNVKYRKGLSLEEKSSDHIIGYYLDPSLTSISSEDLNRITSPFNITSNQTIIAHILSTDTNTIQPLGNFPTVISIISGDFVIDDILSSSDSLATSYSEGTTEITLNRLATDSFPESIVEVYSLNDPSTVEERNFIDEVTTSATQTTISSDNVQSNASDLTYRKIKVSLFFYSTSVIIGDILSEDNIWILATPPKPSGLHGLVDVSNRLLIVPIDERIVPLLNDQIDIELEYKKASATSYSTESITSADQFTTYKTKPRIGGDELTYLILKTTAAVSSPYTYNYRIRFSVTDLSSESPYSNVAKVWTFATQHNSTTLFSSRGDDATNENYQTLVRSDIDYSGTEIIPSTIGKDPQSPTIINDGTTSPLTENTGSFTLPLLDSNGDEVGNGTAMVSYSTNRFADQRNTSLAEISQDSVFDLDNLSCFRIEEDGTQRLRITAILKTGVDGNEDRATIQEKVMCFYRFPSSSNTALRSWQSINFGNILAESHSSFSTSISRVVNASGEDATNPVEIFITYRRRERIPIPGGSDNINYFRFLYGPKIISTTADLSGSELSNINIVPGDASATVSWDRKDTATKYVIFINNSTFSIDQPAVGTNISYNLNSTDHGLVNGVASTFEIYTFFGDWKHKEAQQTVTPSKPPVAPTEITTSVLSLNSISVEFTIAHQEGVSYSYTLGSNAPEAMTITRDDPTSGTDRVSITLEDITAGADYTQVITATNSNNQTATYTAPNITVGAPIGDITGIGNLVIGNIAGFISITINASSVQGATNYRVQTTDANGDTIVREYDDNIALIFTGGANQWADVVITPYNSIGDGNSYTTELIYPGVDLPELVRLDAVSSTEEDVIFSPIQTTITTPAPGNPNRQTQIIKGGRIRYIEVESPEQDIYNEVPGTSVAAVIGVTPLANGTQRISGLDETKIYKFDLSLSYINPDNTSTVASDYSSPLYGSPGVPTQPTIASLQSSGSTVQIVMLHIPTVDSYEVKYWFGGSEPQETPENTIQYSSPTIDLINLESSSFDYTVKVRALRSVGGVVRRSAYSSPQTFKITANLQPPQIESYPGNGLVVLEWDPIPNATHYRIYEYRSPTDLIDLAELNNRKTRYVVNNLVNGNTYRFRVEALIKSSGGLVEKRNSTVTPQRTPLADYANIPTINPQIIDNKLIIRPSDGNSKIGDNVRITIDKDFEYEGQTKKTLVIDKADSDKLSKGGTYLEIDAIPGINYIVYAQSIKTPLDLSSPPTEKFRILPKENYRGYLQTMSDNLSPILSSDQPGVQRTIVKVRDEVLNKNDFPRKKRLTGTKNAAITEEMLYTFVYAKYLKDNLEIVRAEGELLTNFIEGIFGISRFYHNQPDEEYKKYVRYCLSHTDVSIPKLEKDLNSLINTCTITIKDLIKITTTSFVSSSNRMLFFPSLPESKLPDVKKRTPDTPATPGAVGTPITPSQIEAFKEKIKNLKKDQATGNLQKREGGNTLYTVTIKNSMPSRSVIKGDSNLQINIKWNILVPDDIKANTLLSIKNILKYKVMAGIQYIITQEE